MCSLLISSTSFLKINGLKGQSFYHRKGLRQGDPLSLLLFIMAVGSLQAMISKIRDELIDLPIAMTTLLQFADDTPIVTLAYAKIIKLIMTTLETFAQVSGLKINLSKSDFLPIKIPLDLVPTVASLLKFNPLTFPIQYLGFPLTIKKPPKSAYLPLLANIQRRCEGFKGKKPLHGKTNDFDQLSFKCDPTSLHVGFHYTKMDNQANH
jgi:Reverse transcriptase (RNA-dependent DNA polymerase)